MESLLRLRTRARALLNLPETVPWWQRRKASQHTAQLSFGFNVALLAIGLPVAWNWVVQRKWSEYLSRKAAEGEPPPDAALLELEKAAVEMLVNDRRRERGVPPYAFYSFSAETHPAATALFDGVLAVRRGGGGGGGAPEIFFDPAQMVSEDRLRTAMRAVPPPLATAAAGAAKEECGC